MGTTRGFWDPEDGTVESFDNTMREHTPPGENYSRSEKVLDALRLYESVVRTIARTGEPIRDEHTLRSYVRQALLDQARREANE